VVKKTEINAEASQIGNKIQGHMKLELTK